MTFRMRETFHFWCALSESRIYERMGYPSSVLSDQHGVAALEIPHCDYLFIFLCHTPNDAKQPHCYHVMLLTIKNEHSKLYILCKIGSDI